MIDMQYLKDSNGASRFGSCVNCGAESADGEQMAWISFAPNNSGFNRSICLCRICRLKLASLILLYAIKEDGENAESGNRGKLTKEEKHNVRE